MSHRHDDEHEEREELRLIREVIRLLKELVKIARHEPVLTSIVIRWGGIMPIGPVSLNVGQSTTASIVGKDQFGAPWTGPIPPVSFAVDNPAIASSTPNADGVTDVVAGVSAGTANLAASLTTVEGVPLTANGVVNVAAPPPPAPVLTSIDIDFSTPTP